MTAVSAIGQPPDLRSLLTLAPDEAERALADRVIEAAVSLYLGAYADKAEG